MKQVILNVSEKNYKSFMKLVSDLDYVTVEEKKEKRKDDKILKSIAKGLKEVKQIRNGQLEKKNIDNLLREL